jgi:flagellar biosynthesis protein FlhF
MTPARFRGRTTAEALDAVRRAFGDDAVLLEAVTAADGAMEILAAPPAPRHDADAPGVHVGVEVFLGAPGDGKTTVLAKLAVAAHRAGRRVALVATDVHRLGASAELDALGRALAVPVVRATSPADVAGTCARLADVDRLLIDTTGAAPGHAAILAEVEAIVRASGAHARRTLVVAATSAPSVVDAVVAAFERVAPTDAVVTKTDCAPWEPIASQITGHGLTVRALARSRSVADSLIPAGPNGLARRLLAA